MWYGVQASQRKTYVTRKVCKDLSMNKLNITTLKERREFLSVKFSKKCLQNEKTCTMFKNNIKNHKMKLRNSDKFYVTVAKTERLKKSTIPDLQKLLNLEHTKKLNMQRNMGDC